MRSSLAIIALIPTFAIADTYIQLWELVEIQSKIAAPASIQEFLTRAQRVRINDCISEQSYPVDALHNYFSAVPLPIGKYPDTYLVYPSRPCMEFVGAHSVEFWIIELPHDGSVSILFHGRQDALSVLRTSTHGRRDISLHYGGETSALRFNGHHYAVVPQ